MAYPVKEVANYFLNIADVDGVPVSPMKLQKLLYYAHGWCLALTAAPLFDAPIEAWPYGPVVREIYGQFRQYGNAPITSRARLVNIIDNSFNFETPELPDGPDHEFTRDFLRKIWDVYGDFTAVQLSNMTHILGGPWAVTVAQNGGNTDGKVIISNELIRQYFAEEAHQNLQATTTA